MHRLGELSNVDRLIVIGVVMSLAVAACAATDTLTVGNDAPATDPAAEPAALPVVISATTTATTSPAATTSTTTTSTSTTTDVPTTTVAPSASVVTDVCGSLEADGFETRRVVVDAMPGAFEVASGVGDGRAEVAAECGDALSRFDGAMQIRRRLETIDQAEEDGLPPVTLTDFVCDETSFGVTVTNDAAIPLGLHANFAMYLGDDREDAVQSSAAPLVVWSIAPGESEQVAGDFVGFVGEQVYCEFNAQVFDADPSDADASIGDATHPGLTGDDPSSWLPALLDAGRTARTSGDIDLVALTEDVRSMSYDEVALAIAVGVALPEAELIEVCERGRSRPDAEHIGLVYLDRLADEVTRLSHGLFRRGSDGQWRWLSTARYFESTLSDDCGAVDPAAV